VLGACMKYEATFAIIWSMFEHGGDLKGTDFNMIDGNGTPRTSYRHMEFIVKYSKGNYAGGSSTSQNVRVFGASNGDLISVMIMNREGKSQPYTLRLDQKEIRTDKLILHVNAGTATQCSDVIPGQTTQVLLFKGHEVTKWVYIVDNFLNDRPPSFTKFSLRN